MTLVLRRFWRDDSGITIIDYALVASIVSIVIISSLQSMSEFVKGTFNGVADRLD